MENKKASMLPSSEGIDLNGLKLVKNATIFSERGIFFIRHYSTIIFAYNPQSRLCEINKNCSVTSNRQIRYALRFFEVLEENTVDVSDGTKWQYGGRL